ncbi:MAG: hypothetical protein WCX64_04605 [Candidatus Micrarchaeia archaeon]|jgi:hypothetical protein
MIFVSLDEFGVPAWKKILDGSKTATRRLKPLMVGTDFAVQPGRGVKAVCRAVVTTCVTHGEWYAMEIAPLTSKRERFAYSVTGFVSDHFPVRYEGTAAKETAMLSEAKEEGFETVEGWLAWYPAHGIDINRTYRIGFEKILPANLRKRLF